MIAVRFSAEHVTDVQATIEARLALWRALQGRGDERFPHFRYDFAGEEVPGEAGE